MHKTVHIKSGTYRIGLTSGRVERWCAAKDRAAYWRKVRDGSGIYDEVHREAKKS